jgi:acyl-coenzyme A thioesterase 13
LCTTLAVIPCSTPQFWPTGHFSRTLSCTYLRPAALHTDLIIECEVVHLGKNLGELKGTIRRADNGKLCYLASHGKARVNFPSLLTLAEKDRDAKKTVATTNTTALDEPIAARL